ncbi:site-specific integrase [Mycobacteroides abscessus]|nr:site-specific integrase [Mycobacteroides abscessus]MDM1905302.1 site-specific integrase [Mycobacteroides abscessus]MDM1910846.1 site-specific integrase [Mycobacteroides abscessus]MDM1919883.1 site-specific integrase [Mycobacteroides abscessus]
MAGRPPLRIGQHGKVTRKPLGGGLWLARCRYRDADGVTRIVERQGSSGKDDKNGLAAENALIDSLEDRRPPTDAGEVSPDTLVMVLVMNHLDRLEEDGRSPATLATYRFAAGKLKKFLGGVRVREASVMRLDAAVRSMRTAHGVTMARQSRTILRGGLQLAVMANAIPANPARDLGALTAKVAPKGATALTASQVRGLLAEVRTSNYSAEHDIADPITLLIATGLRRSELLALRWTDFSEDSAELTVAGKLVRATGHGLKWIDGAKTDAGRRTLPLPRFAVAMLRERRGREYLGEQTMIFPSTAGTWRDPNNFGKQWRKIRAELGVPDVTSHSFRKSVATMIDDAGLSARVGADQLGHSKVSMTQDRYMARGRVHTQVADLLDRTISDE